MDPLLRAYDDHLRDEAEVVSALRWERLGPLVLATYPGGRGFITYRHLHGYDVERLRALVVDAVARLAANPGIVAIEWKARGHDDVPDLPGILAGAGFVAGEVESVMIGRCADLAVDVPLPAGVTLRTIASRPDVERMEGMASEVFGRGVPGIVDSLMARLERGDGTELWVAEAATDHGPLMVSVGRLEPVPGTTFAGIWGGCTRPEWRGRGIYRALTAARARSALRLGKEFIHSDSTAFSRPILERSGFRAVTATTPWQWRRPD